MKVIITITSVILLLMAGCKENKQPADGLITVDVTASYPKKELILQDFMDVEYIPLETNDEFVCQGLVRAIGKDIIVLKNRANDGNIYIFDRQGKALKKINRLGQGAEEYGFIMGIILDEENGEMFVNDLKRIIVYDLDGNYKRSFRHKEGTMYDYLYNFDRENLICHDGNVSNSGEANRQGFMLISKLDGSITREIEIPFKEKKITAVIQQDPTNKMTYGATPNSDFPIIPNLENWVLVEPSSDTLFTILPDYSLKPFLARSPSIQSMNPEIFLFLSSITDRYYFMEVVEKTYDFGTQDGFPRTNIMYDKQEQELFEFIVYNGDYSTKKQVYMNLRPFNNEIVTSLQLNADELVDAYEKGQLRGKLKEVAANLDEESNPVIIVAKQKK